MSQLADFAELDATAQAELARSGAASPLELVDAAIARIESLDSRLNAVIHRRFERAREDARGPLPSGPFRGVPILLKDLGNPMAGEPHYSGNPLLKRLDRRAAGDSAFTKAIRAAGFIVLGRTNVPEFGLVCTTEPKTHGPTRNPWALDRSAGGSSGGSAAAVASGMVAIAQATDGGGSIRMPSSHCGLLGLKPSRGRISSAPEGEGMEGHTTNGFLATSVRDCAASLDLASGYQPGDAYTPPRPATSYALMAQMDPPKLRIGLMDVAEVNGHPVDDDVREAARAGARLLESLGHSVEMSYPAAMTDPEYLDRWRDLLSPSVTALFEELELLAGRPLRREDAGEMAWWWRDAGARLSAARHVANQTWRDGFVRRLASWWNDFDLMVSPVLPNAAPPLGQFDQPDGLELSVRILCFTPQFNTSGQPAVSVPLFTSPAGLPIGVQLAAAYGREDLLLQVCRQLEEAAPWRGRRPALSAG